MDTFIRLDLGYPVYFLDATAVELPGDPAGIRLFDKAVGFYLERVLGAPEDVKTLVIIRVGEVDVRVPFDVPDEEIQPLAQDVYALGEAGRQEQASARYRGGFPHAQIA